MSKPEGVRVHHGQVRVIDSQGNPGRLKLRRVLEHASRGNGAFVNGVFVFPQRQCAPRQTVNVTDLVTAFVRLPVGHAGKVLGAHMGFLPYPQPSRGLGAKFPGLARVGAGLA